MHECGVVIGEIRIDAVAGLGGSEPIIHGGNGSCSGGLSSGSGSIGCCVTAQAGLTLLHGVHTLLIAAFVSGIGSDKVETLYRGITEALQELDVPAELDVIVEKLIGNQRLACERILEQDSLGVTSAYRELDLGQIPFDQVEPVVSDTDCRQGRQESRKDFGMLVEFREQELEIPCENAAERDYQHKDDCQSFLHYDFPFLLFPFIWTSPLLPCTEGRR